MLDKNITRISRGQSYLIRLASRDAAERTNLVVQFLQKLLGGEMHGDGLLHSCGRGCLPQDRSLVIKSDPYADFGFEASQSRTRDSDQHTEAWIVSEVETYFDGVEPLIKSSKEFVADFIPPDYLIDGMLQEVFLYSLTGATGAGKTAITLRLAASCARGMPFAGRDTKKTRVLYLAAENSADVRMRWIATAQQMDFDPDDIEVFFIDRVFRMSEGMDFLKDEAELRGGRFGLVIIDTSPVFYEGDDESSRRQQGEHAVMLRSLIRIIPGNPAIIANCHPVKNALADNLIPAGGGNFLNSVDGNLTAAKTDSTVELHWQGKFRGVEFAPVHFMLRTVTHERLKDSKGTLIPTVVCDWISESAKEEIARAKISDQDRLLALIDADLKATHASLAVKMDWRHFNGDPYKTKVKRCVDALLAAKLIKATRRGNWMLTPAGKDALAETGRDK
jgi:hypothetical protein